MHYLVWDASQIDRYVNMHNEVPWDHQQQKELEAIKDDFLSKSHVHSFTYDFHLRMVATYLVGGQQVSYFLLRREYSALTSIREVCLICIPSARVRPTC